MKEFLKYIGFRLITFGATTFPRPLIYWIAIRLADLCYLVDRKAREAVKANLRVILGPKASEDIVAYEARWVFRGFGMYLAEFFGYRRFGEKFIDEHVVARGIENVDAALLGGRGAIICSGHYSNWEMAAAVLVRLGYKVTAIGQMHADPTVNELFIRQRAKRGYTLLAGARGASEALRVLRRNELLVILGDRVFGDSGVEVELFGRKTILPQGPFRLAVASGAPLIPGMIRRRMNRNFTGYTFPAIVPPKEGSREDNIRFLAREWAKRFEEWVREDPCQWACFLRMWDDEKSGEPGFAQSGQFRLREARKVLEATK